MLKSFSAHTLWTLFLTLCLAVLLPTLSWGEEEDDVVELFDAFQVSSSTASRAPKPLSQTAENVTVITAEDIRQLNAHTLADILITIPGIQTETIGSVGNLVTTHIQSSANTHVSIFVDGVPLNNVDNFSDVSLVSAQIIERVEIIKGAASSVWGQALGGVINVVTKTPDSGRTIGGSLSASIGERKTADTRAELSGTTGQLGYYLSGGFLGTNGFTPHTAVSSNGIYAKLTLDLPDNSGQLWSTVKYDRIDRGTFWSPPEIGNDKQDMSFHNFYATLGMRKHLTGQLELEFLGRHASRDSDILDAQITDNAPMLAQKTRERVSGGSGKLVWSGNDNLLVAGVDYEHFETKSRVAYIPIDMLNRTVDRWGVYLNDTAVFGPVSVIPGARFDHTESSGDQFSPSLGAVWQITDATLLRGYAVRGYSLPSLYYDRTSEKVWTTQLGVESSAVPNLWLKGTLFRNDIWGIKATDADGNPITERHIALGTELEARTTPILNTTLGIGWTFTDSIRTSDGAELVAVPRHTVQLALRYDDKTYRAHLTGRHVWWNSNIEPGYNGKYNGLMWDLHLGATLLKKQNSSLELFFSGHNLFNNNQFWVDAYPSTPRWFEGGVRANF